MLVTPLCISCFFKLQNPVISLRSLSLCFYFIDFHCFLFADSNAGTGSGILEFTNYIATLHISLIQILVWVVVFFPPKYMELLLMECYHSRLICFHFLQPPPPFFPTFQVIKSPEFHTGTPQTVLSRGNCVPGVWGKNIASNTGIKWDREASQKKLQ